MQPRQIDIVPNVNRQPTSVVLVVQREEVWGESSNSSVEKTEVRYSQGPHNLKVVKLHTQNCIPIFELGVGSSQLVPLLIIQRVVPGVLLICTALHVVKYGRRDLRERK